MTDVEIAGVSTADHVEYLLRLADDALILSHRLTEWSSWAPQLEEDIALTNIALDLLGQARSLLTHAGELESADRDEDDFAYLRQENEFRCCLLVEQPTRGDFGAAIAVLLLFSSYLVPLYQGARALHRPDGRGDRRQGDQGGALPPRARRRMDRPAG